MRLILQWLTSCLVLAPNAAHGVPTTSSERIEWHAPAACGTSEDLRRGVVQLLGGTPSGLDRESFVAEVEEGSPGHWRLNLTGTSSRGSWTRTLEGIGCTELLDAAKVMIALAIEPARAAEWMPRRDSPEALAPIAPNAGSTAEQRVPSDADRQPTGVVTAAHRKVALRRVAFGVSAPSQPNQARTPVRDTVPIDSTWITTRTGLAWLALPNPTPIVSLGALQRHDRFSVRGSAGWMASQRQHSSDQPNAGAHVSLAFANGELGYAWQAESLELEVRAGVVAGAMVAKSFGIAGGKTGYGPFASLDAGLTMAFPASGVWALELSADGLVNCIAPNFRATGVGQVYEADLMGGLLSLGFRIRVK